MTAETPYKALYEKNLIRKQLGIYVSNRFNIDNVIFKKKRPAEFNGYAITEKQVQKVLGMF